MSGPPNHGCDNAAQGGAGEGGFALIEFLIAFAILSIGLVLLMNGLAQSRQSGAVLNREIAALQFAQALFEGEHRPQAAKLEPLSSGQTENGLRWTIRRSLSAKLNANGGITPVWVEITVAWPSGHGVTERSIALKSMLLLEN